MAALHTFVACLGAVMLMAMIAPSEGAAASRSRGPYIPKKKPTVVQPALPVVEPEGNSQSPSGSIQVKGSTDDEAMRHIEELENTVTTMKQDKVELEQSLHALRLVTLTLQNDLHSITNKVAELDRISTNNRELTRLLTYFETFFGVLYREDSETFNPNVPVETRLSRMNTYIGNRDAELAGIRPKPNVVVSPDTTGVSDEVSNAVIQLGQENAQLAAQVTTLAQDLESTNAEVKSAKSKAASGGYGGGSCTCNTETIDERILLLERTTALLVAPILEDNAATYNDGTAASRKAGSRAGTEIDLMSEGDVDILRESLFESRAVSDTRKSVFSAIRHSHMIGDDTRQTLTFDTVHVNKGGHFKNNSIFECHVEGFYFFHYTVRSYDGHYMGVALVKDAEMMTSIYTDASERSIMQSQSTVLHMRRGEQVSLELGSSERFAVHSDVHKYITFNGFLIYKGR